MELSIVVPAYNEQRRLPATLRAWLAFLAAQPLTWELLVVDDGSTDQTPTVVAELAAAQPGLRLIRLPANQGKGAAVRAGMLQAAGAHVFYVDADLNVSPRYVPTFVRLLNDGYDVAIGRRSSRQYSATERSVGRVAAGLLVQVTRRALLLPVYRDTQCGFKGFRRAAAAALFGQATIAGFAFDVEILYLAWKKGYRVAEVPVAVERREGSTYSLRRHLLPFLRDIATIKRQDLAGAYDRPPRARC